MPLHATLGEVAHACKSIFFSPKGSQSTHLDMQEATQLLGENAHFWLGVGLATRKICTISR